MRSLAAVLALLLSAATLTGCDRVGRMAGAPSPTTVPDNLPVDSPRGPKVAVCYSGGVLTMDDLVTAAVAQCKEPGSTVEYLTGDLHFNECPLFKKRRAVFVCHEPR